MGPDDLRRPQDLLPVTPVHVLQVVVFGHAVEGQHVEGDGRDAQIGQLLVDVQVGPGVRAVVRPSDEDHHLLAGLYVRKEP